MLDAVLNAPGDKLWAFKGASYWLINQASGELISGPHPLSQWASDNGGLPGQFAAGIDAASWAGPSFPKSFYVFRDSLYVRLDHPAFDFGLASDQVNSGEFERSLQIAEFRSIDGDWCCNETGCFLTHAPSAAVHGLGFEEVDSIFFFESMHCLRHGLLGEGLIGSPETTSLDRWRFPVHGGPIDLAFRDTRDGNNNLFLVSGMHCARFDGLTDELREVQPFDQAFPTLWQLAGLSGQYLAIRRQDLAVIGVRWTGLSPSGANELEATSDDARLVVTLPPQAIGEQVSAAFEGQPFASPQPRRGLPAAPSQLALSMQRGDRLSLSLTALFEAIERASVRTGLPAKGLMHTMLDMPSGLLWWPLATDGGAVRIQSTRKTSGDVNAAWPLWRIDLRGNTLVPAVDAGLQMQAWAARPDPTPQPFADPAVMSLSSDDRRDIVVRARAGPVPTVERLRLATPGGDLRALGAWPDLIWQHDVQFGRDQSVYVQRSGRLFPFGHRATLFTVTTRELVAPPPPAPPMPPPAPSPSPFPPAPFPSPPPPFPPNPPLMHGSTVGTRLTRAASSPQASASLVQRSVLIVEDPVCLTADASGAPARAFPFDAVVLLETYFDGVTAAGSGGPLIHDKAGNVHLFALRLAHPSGDLSLSLPLAFVPDNPAFNAQNLNEHWAREAAVTLPGVLTDLLRMPQPKQNDLIELHGLQWTAEVRADNPWLPRIDTFDAVLPALRAMELSFDSPRRLRFDPAGDVRAPMRLVEEIAIDFTKKASRSGGLVTPRYAVNAVSRTLGPVPDQALDGLTQTALAAFRESRLLGISLAELIDLSLPAQAPTVVPLKDGVRVIGGTMTWTLPLKDVGPILVERNNTKLNLTAVVNARGSDVTCTINDLSYQLPRKLLTIGFSSIVWHQPPAQPAALDLRGVSLEFGAELNLFKDLLDRAMELIGVPGGLHVRKLANSVIASWDLPIPEASCVSFTLRHVALRLAVEVPLDDKPVTASLGFSSRDKPFSLTVLGLGGGGHVALTFGGKELGIEASMEFGALVALNLGVVSAEVHAFGGIRFERLDGGDVRLTAYIRIGGSVNLLGLISVALELLVQLAYEAKDNSLVGSASIVIEVDLTFYSDSFRLDSGEWKLLGGSGPLRKLRRLDPLIARDQWLRYQASFA